MRVDVNAFLGHYPYRRITGGAPPALLEAMDRVAIDRAWISNLPAIFWKDPAAGNPVLFEWAGRQPRFLPVPAVHPGMPEWGRVLDDARGRGAPAVRADPAFYGIDPAGPEMRELAGACAEAGLPLVLAVRLEDGRQRHPNDHAGDLTPANLRALIRAGPKTRFLITHADRELIEQVHFGSTPAEAERVLWDISWIWGPPEDHLELLLQTVGIDRFTFGTGMPLRLPETSVAKLDLLSLSPEARHQVESGNLEALLDHSR